MVFGWFVLHYIHYPMAAPRYILKFLPFWIFMVFFKFGGGLHYTLIPALGERVLPVAIVGLVMGGSSVIQILLDVPAGLLLDRFGYKRMIAITTAVFIVAVLLFIFPFSTAVFLVSVLISSFGWLFFGPGISAYALAQSANRSFGKFLALQDMSGAAGIVLATLMLPLALSHSTRFIGISLAIVLGIALIGILAAPHERRHGIPQPISKRPGFKNIVATMRRLNPASTMLMLSTLSASAFYGVIWFVVPLVIARSSAGSLLGFGLSVFDLSIVVLGFFLGRMVDKGNQRILIAIGLVLFASAGVLISFNLNALFLLLGFLATTGDELSGLSLWKWLHTLDKTHAEDGLVSSVITFFSDTGWAVGPIVAGILYPLIGPEWTLFVGALFLCITVATYFALYRRKHVNIVGPVPHRIKRPHRIR